MPSEEFLRKIIEKIWSIEPRAGMFPYVLFEESEIIELLEAATELLKSEPILLRINSPIVVCGDTHGSVVDSLRIFKTLGTPEETKFLFLGDYVDRGAQSIENVMLLVAYKLLCPYSVFLLKGNHECEDISSFYGLREECIMRYSHKVYWAFLKMFGELPVAAVVDGTVFCVHGGISSELETLDQIDHLTKKLSSDEDKLLNDLLWADPSPEVKDFEESPRGASYVFGKAPLDRFLDRNNLECVIRSHEFCDGISMPFGSDGRIITVFSALNYCNMRSLSAVATIDQDHNIKFIFFKTDKP